MKNVVGNSLQSYEKGKTLFVSGNDALAVYLILDGRVIASQAGENVLLGPGAILGEVAFFEEVPHFYSAICASELKVVEMSRENIREVFAKQPVIACSLLRELAITAKQEGKMYFEQGVEVEEKEIRSPEGLLPKGHPVFSQLVPADHSELLFTTEVECPICATKFSGLRTKTSRLQAAEHRADFRAIYRNFEPNFYYIWVCPHCLFAYPERQYMRLSRRAIDKGQVHWQEHPPEFSFAFDAQRTIHQVISAYYLTLNSFAVVGATPEQRANLWLRLMWIYEDLEEDGLALGAAQEASKYFSEAMSTRSRSASGDQQLYIIMGELDLRQGKTGEAFRNFHSAATMSGGDPRHKRMATDRIQDLREQRDG